VPRKDYQRKNWLQENKIYFETVAAVFLSVAAILVTTAQTIFIFKQARLMDMQTKVGKQQSLPQFIIRRVVFSDPNYKKYYDKHYITDEWIEITNLGGVFYNLQSSEVVILEIEYQYNLQPWKSSKTIQIPVFGYYFTEEPPKNKGRFYIKGNHNLVKFYDLQKDLRTLAGEDYAFLSQKTYLKLTYRDLLGDLHNDYYEINYSSSEGKLISLKEGKTIFDNFEILSVLSSKEYKENKSKDIPIDFATITAKKY
jgi:hypothetical protein